MKKLGALALALMAIPAGFALVGCDDKVEVKVSTREELLTAVANEEVDKIIVKAGNYGSPDDYQNIVVERPVEIEGEKGTKPVIYGSIVVLLDSNETKPVEIENLEISHSGLYVRNDQGVDLSKDGRRGILVKNGSVSIEDNYIHLTEENPQEKYTTSPTGIQISVGATTPDAVKQKLTYEIEGNRLGMYSTIQSSASSVPVAILCATDEAANEKLNLSEKDFAEIFLDNTFIEDSQCYTAYYDYARGRYIAGAFSNEASCKKFLGDDYQEYIDNRDLEFKNGTWILK